MNNFKQVQGTGDAIIMKGDPRLPKDGIDPWFITLLEERKPPYKRPHLYGADAGLCARRNVLLANNDGVPSHISATSNAYMSLGVALEEMLAAGLQKKERLICKQLPLPLMPEVKIRGYIDLVIFDHEDELALVEVKSCGKLPDEPKPTHLIQIQTYCAVTGIERAWLTYLSRNVSEEGEWGKLAIRSFRVDPGADVQKERLSVAMLSHLADQEKTLPQKPVKFRKHTECHYCEFRDLYCWEPRPGREGRKVAAPLPEMTIAQQLTLEATAEAEAARLVSLAPWRKAQTLKDIQGKTFPSLYPRLTEMVDEWNFYLANFLPQNA